MCIRINVHRYLAHEIYHLSVVSSVRVRLSFSSARGQSRKLEKITLWVAKPVEQLPEAAPSKGTRERVQCSNRGWRKQRFRGLRPFFPLDRVYALRFLTLNSILSHIPSQCVWAWVYTHITGMFGRTSWMTVQISWINLLLSWMNVFIYLDKNLQIVDIRN